ncbi:MAG: hypothetical protein Q4B14_01465 [Clostridia bacterium]|nr:hypothetical protein [Clostridia bacterium]
MYKGLVSAYENINEAKAQTLANGNNVNNEKGLSKTQRDSINLSPEIISKEYPVLASSLNNLIKNVEKNVSDDLSK